MTDKELKKATERYNDIMWSICREYLTIGTRLTEDPEHKSKWTLRDMVSEMQYTLDIYEDPSCIYWEDAHDPSQPDREWYNQWRSEIGRMKRFIAKYKDEALTMKCVEGHCSKYD